MLPSLLKRIKFIHVPGKPINPRYLRWYFCHAHKGRFQGFVAPEKCPVCKAREWRAEA